MLKKGGGCGRGNSTALIGRPHNDFNAMGKRVANEHIRKKRTHLKKQSAGAELAEINEIGSRSPVFQGQTRIKKECPCLSKSQAQAFLVFFHFMPFQVIDESFAGCRC